MVLKTRDSHKASMQKKPTTAPPAPSGLDHLLPRAAPLKALVSATFLGSILAAVAAWGLPAPSTPPPQLDNEFDVLIRGGQVFEGSGTEFVTADVGVKDGKIARIGELEGAKGARTISAEGRYVVPGFIDVHCHAERGLPYLELAAAIHYLKQGVTTLVAGADGYGAWPLHETMPDQVDRLTKQGMGVNAALMLGQGQVRRLIMGMEDRSPTAQELRRMKQLVKEAMEDGAQGISSGLAYPPGLYSSTEEVIELVKEVVPYGGIYHTHVRSEADELLEGIEEAIRISEETGAVTMITHFKAVYKRNWGKVRAAADLIEQARARGVKIFADQYPFTEGGTVPLIPLATWWGDGQYVENRTERLAEILKPLSRDSLIDLWAEMAGLSQLEPKQKQYLRSLPRSRLLNEMIAPALSRLLPAEGYSLIDLYSWTGVHRGPGNPNERNRFILRLRDPQESAKIRAQVQDHIEAVGGADQILLLQAAARPELERKTLRQAADMLDTSVVEAAIQLALEDARAIVILLSDEDVDYIIQKDWVATGTDGDFPYLGTGLDSIGMAQMMWSYGTFPMKIRKYALERGVISLPHALRSFTSLPADILGWADRGRLREGLRADITIFNPKTIRPKFTLENIHQYSEGVDYVLVNGKLALDQGRFTGNLAGEVITPQRTRR